MKLFPFGCQILYLIGKKKDEKWLHVNKIFHIKFRRSSTKMICTDNFPLLWEFNWKICTIMSSDLKRNCELKSKIRIIGMNI